MYQISVTRLSSTVCYQVKIDEIFFFAIEFPWDIRKKTT